MEATVYTKILDDKTLVPFIEDVYPSSYKFMADNDPKHTSHYAQWYLEEKGPDQLVAYSSRVAGPQPYWKYVARVERVYQERGEAKDETGTDWWNKGIFGDSRY